MTFPAIPPLKTFPEEVKVEAARRLKPKISGATYIAGFFIEVFFLHECVRVEKEMRERSGMAPPLAPREEEG